MSGSRRRRFISAVNNTLERLLHVNDQNDYSVSDDRQSDELIDIEQDLSLEQQREEFFRNHRRIQEIQRLLLLIPRGLRNRLQNSETLNRIRDLLRDVRLEQLPGHVLDQLNELNLFN